MVKGTARTYDLEDRTTTYAINVIKFCKTARKDFVTTPLLTQLVRCASSIGANYCEADDAESPADFRHKIGICKKESRETKYFLNLMLTIIPESRATLEILCQEAKELNLIFNKIYMKVNNKK
jgi:four helix bundle protein